MTNSTPIRLPTIIDVARKAGVSVATVSRVLREHPDVSHGTRATVRNAIEALGYRPSPIARALVSGRTRLLALLVSDIANPFYPQLAKSVEQAAKQHKYTVIICNTADNTRETRRYLERLLLQGLDGVIHASVGRDEEAVLKLLSDTRRVVFTNRRPISKYVNFVVSDNEDGAYQLTSHLLAKGHTRIGFVGGPAFARNATERLAGFRRAMKDACAKPLIANGDFSVDSGRLAAEAWVNTDDRPTAIIGVNDSVAIGVLETLTKKGLRVPEDVALAGFDGVLLAGLPLLHLTTVDQHIHAMGEKAVQILLRQLTGPINPKPVQETLPTQLLLRRSTEGEPV